ncbi:hypothetical protein BDY19DRAFT_995142 [Irpex rosettiformis]|uniref:Uncharacterized protein n=1 Tax=Irpex rosettiformis TaxID=378272 RepID=A0ACB8U0B5_9APHY|nr:hypothetical protein BDY19DRAFT_995142 [Irpex rosettiformis]
MSNLNNERLANAAEIARISAHTKSTSQKPASSTSSTFARLSNRDHEHSPPLTENERALLFKFNSCFKCCHFFASHRQHDCKNSPPKGAGYKELTEDDAIKAKSNQDKHRQDIPKHSTTVAVVFDEEIDENVSAAITGSPIMSGVLSCEDTDNLDFDV